MILDKLLEYAQIKAAVDVQCLVSGRWQLSHPQRSGRAYVHIVVAGSGLLRQPDSKPQRLYGGDLVFLPQGGEHSISDYHGQGEMREVRAYQHGIWTVKRNTNGREDLSMLCGRFDYQPQSDLFQGWPQVVMVPWLQLPQLRTWVKLLQGEVQALEEEGGYSAVNALSQLLLVWLVRYCQQQPWQDALLGVWRAHQDVRLRHLLAMVMNEPAAKWTVESMAEMAHLSRAQFMRVFQAALGQSPHQFVLHTRLQQAAVYLRQRGDSVLQIALACGFQTEPHFVRVFKQYHGLTPRQYRIQAVVT